MFIEDFVFIQSINILLFTSFILMIIYLVWKSTEVRREVQPFENIQISVRRSSSILSNTSTISNSTIEDNLSNVEELTQNIFEEAASDYNSSAEISQGIAAVEDETISEEDRIIREMDRDVEISSSIRTRTSRHISQQEVQATSTSDSSSFTSTPPSSSNSNENIQMIKDGDKISIKLKYLNDEIKNVECFMSESLGNFKKRNFKTELESKLIKLIFNGKLLEDDKKSIRDCGIFSEAVVHCLVLQKKNLASASTVNNSQNANANNRRRNEGTSFNNFEWNIVGLILVSLTLFICWFCRFYAYNWYSTIALISLTSLFVILIPLFTRIFS